MGIETYRNTAAGNDHAGALFPEQQTRSSVNNGARQVQADLRVWYNDAEWIQYGDGNGPATIAYASATSFTVAGVDVTAVYHAGRRVKAQGSATGTIYGKIDSSSFSTDTTVNVTWDSGSLQNESLTVWIGATSAVNTSFPTDSLVLVPDGSVTDAKLVQTPSGLEDIVALLNTATNAFGSAEVTATGAITARSLAARFAEIYNVKDYGALGDGATDDAAAIQAAIDAAEAGGGGLVWFPVGDYRFGTGLVIDASAVRLVGETRGTAGTGTRLKYTSATGDWITFSGVVSGGISGLRLEATVTVTAGHSLVVSACPDFRCSDLDIDGCWNGIKIDGGDRSIFEHIRIDNGRGTFGIRLVGESDKLNSTRLRAINVASETKVAPYHTAFAGFLFDSNIATTHCEDLTALYCVNGFRFANNLGAPDDIKPKFHYMERCETEKNNAVGWAIDACEELEAERCYAAGATTHNFRINDSEAVISISQLKAAGAQQHGVLIAACRRVTLIAPQIYGNSQESANTYDGIRINPGVSHIHINGGVSGYGSNGDPGGATPQRYGINIGNGASDFITIIGTDPTGNTTGHIFNGASGSNVVIANNLGTIST